MTRFGDWIGGAGAAVAAACFLALLWSLAGVPAIPWLVVAGLGALVVLAALRPDAALAALAMGIPVASWLGRQWNPSVAWAEAPVVAFCAGYCARGALASVRKTNDPRDPLDAPILLTTGVVCASLAAQILIDAWRFGGNTTLVGLGELASWWYFLMPVNGDPIDAAMRLLESLILLRAAATVARRTPAFGPRLLACAVSGAAIASALNLARLWEAALRLDAPLTAFLGYVMSERFNVHYGDVNAAGSYFVLALFTALGLSLAPKRRLWAIAVVVIAGSVWITSSRTAMMVAALAMLLPAGALAMRIRRVNLRGTAIAATAAGLAVVAGVAAYAIPQRGNQTSALAATQVRLEMARTSLLMTRSSPAFGVGIGRYYSRSGEFSSPELIRLFPPAIHENAHNNFLQFLAELGIVGFAAVLWLLWTAARSCARLLAAERRDPIRWGLVTGLLAFVLSWLGGHPLLVDEPAFTFWLLLGIACGWDPYLAAEPPARRSPTRWVAAVLIPLLAASIPLQVIQQRASADLEHRGIGLSLWQPAMDGVRYRLAGVKSSVFVPTGAQMLVIPLRSVSDAPEVRVEVTLDGRPADVVTIVNHRWHYLRLRLTHDREAPRFRRLEFQTAPASGDRPALMIGKVEPR
jgi:O-antigen ligase